MQVWCTSSSGVRRRGLGRRVRGATAWRNGGGGAFGLRPLVGGAGRGRPHYTHTLAHTYTHTDARTRTVSAGRLSIVCGSPVRVLSSPRLPRPIIKYRTGSFFVYRSDDRFARTPAVDTPFQNRRLIIVVVYLKNNRDIRVIGRRTHRVREPDARFTAIVARCADPPPSAVRRAVVPTARAKVVADRMSVAAGRSRAPHSLPPTSSR